MANTKPGVKVESLDNEFRSIRRTYRGKTYVVTELPYIDYQKTLKQAGFGTSKDDGTSAYDSDAHNALLLGKCVKVDGRRVVADDLYERGTGLVRQLIADIGKVNLDEEVEEDEPESGDDGEGEAPVSTLATAS